jgi:hypothetical protein
LLLFNASQFLEGDQAFPCQPALFFLLLSGIFLLLSIKEESKSTYLITKTIPRIVPVKKSNISPHPRTI